MFLGYVLKYKTIICKLFNFSLFMIQTVMLFLISFNDKRLNLLLNLILINWYGFYLRCSMKFYNYKKSLIAWGGILIHGQMA